MSKEVTEDVYSGYPAVVHNKPKGRTVPPVSRGLFPLLDTQREFYATIRKLVRISKRDFNLNEFQNKVIGHK